MTNGRHARPSGDDRAGAVRIGWIGVGKMGSPMVRAVLAAGYRVRVHEPLLENRASAVAAGAEVADSLEELVAGSDAVVTTLARDEVLHDIVFGPQGLARHLRAPQVFMDLSTVSPRLSAEIAHLLETRGIDYLRAPVSGSTATALSAQLTVMASGPRRAWERLEPVVASFSARRFWVGEGEEARYLKLAVNVLVGGTSALLGEALAVGQRGCVPLPLLLDVICSSAAGSPLLRYKRDAIVADEYDPAFSLGQMIRDLELIGEVADDAGLALPLTDDVRRRFEAARRRGLAEQDYFVLVRDHLDGTREPESRGRAVAGRVRR